MASKPVSQQHNLSSSQVTSKEISQEERHRMIAEAAYFNAEHQGFQHGDPDQDWLLAEKQIEQQLHC